MSGPHENDQGRARTSKLAQQRSRETLEQILAGAAEELLHLETPEELTTTDVAERLGLPVGTIYRYFADRWEIIATLIDREIEAVDEILARELEAIERVTLEGLLNLFMNVHNRRLSENPLSKILWFDSRGNEIVRAKIDARYAQLARWAQDGAVGAGLTDGYPSWGADTLIWMCDRTFELMFRGNRSREDELSILEEATAMFNGRLIDYATTAGLEGVPTELFLEHAGRLD